MPVPTVLSSSPVADEVDVSSDKRMKIVFSTALLRSSVNPGTLLLYETDGLNGIEGKITFSDDSTTVYFLPTQRLQASFSYTLVAVGASDALPAGAIEAADGSELATTYSVDFRTGTERFVSLEEMTDRDDIAHVAPIRDSSDLAEVTGVLSIVSTTPESLTTLQDPSTISIRFDEELDADLFQTDWLTIAISPILDYGVYYYGGVIAGVNTLRIEDDDVETDAPAGTVVNRNLVDREEDAISLGASYAITGDSATTYPYNATLVSYDKLIWKKLAGETWPLNAVVTITLSKDITGVSGNKLGTDVDVVFTTGMFPMFVGVNYVRLEIGSAIKELLDDTVNRIVLKRSIESWELAGREFSLTNPPYAAREFTKWGSFIDILDELTLKAELQRGMSKRLGDFEVKYDGRSSMKESGKYQSALKGLADTEYKLRRWAASLRPRVTTVGESSPIGTTTFQGIRNWDNLITSGSTWIPAANWKDQREFRVALDNGLNIGTNDHTTKEMLSVIYGRFQSGVAGGGFYISRRA